MPLGRNVELLGRFLDGFLLGGGFDSPEVFGALANYIDTQRAISETPCRSGSVASAALSSSAARRSCFPCSADHLASKVRHLRFGWIAPYLDQRDMAAGVIQARRHEPLHAQLAHVAERHRRTSRSSLSLAMRSCRSLVCLM